MRFIVSSVLFLFGTVGIMAQVPGAREERDYDYDIISDYAEEEMVEVAPEMEMVEDSYYSERPYYRSYSRDWTYYYEDGKMGLQVNGIRISAAIYTSAVAYAPYGYLVRNDRQYGFVDSTGKEILGFDYDRMEVMMNEYISVTKDGKSALYDMRGKQLIKFKHKRIVAVNGVDQIAVIDKKDKYHLLSIKGKMLVKDASSIDIYSNGAIVRKDDKYALYARDKHSGFDYDELAFPTSYRRSRRYSNRERDSRRSEEKKSMLIQSNLRKQLELVTVEKDGLIGLLDTNIQLVVPIENENIKINYYPKFYQVVKGRMIGAFLPNCNKYLEPKYTSVQRATTNALEVVYAGKHGLVNLNSGLEVVPAQYDDVQGNYEGYITTDKRLNGLIDTNGKVLLNCEYSRIYHLYTVGRFDTSETFFNVEQDDQVGVYSGDQGFVIPLAFDKVRMLNKTFFVVEKNKKFGLYNLQGEMLLATEYDYIDRVNKSSKNKVYLAVKEGNLLVLNELGQKVVEDEIASFNSPVNERYERDLDPYSNDENLKVVKLASGKVGVMNLLNQNYAIPALYDEILLTTEDYRLEKKIYLVRQKDKYGIVDQDNKIRVPFVYDSLQLYQNESVYRREGDRELIHLVAAKKGKYGIINTMDSVILPFKYEGLGKLGVGLYKAKKGKYYQLIDETGKVLNAGPFDDITQFEILSRYDQRTWLARNQTRVALTFYQGKMRELSEKGLFLSEAVEMQKHEGYRTMEELKEALKKALNSSEDKELKLFVKKICISDHLLHWSKPYLDNEMRKMPDFNYLSIQAQYYEELVKFKQLQWNDSTFNKHILDIEEYSERHRGVVVSRSHLRNYDAEALNHILRDCIKINGYWISSYFLRLYDRG